MFDQIIAWMLIAIFVVWLTPSMTIAKLIIRGQNDKAARAERKLDKKFGPLVK